MKQLYSAILLSLLSFGMLSAQPAINYVDFSAFLGQSTDWYEDTTSLADTAMIVQAGANQTWDFSNLSGFVYLTQTFATPAGAPDRDSFPSANYVIESLIPNFGTVYHFIDQSNSGILDLGHSGITMDVYSDPGQIMVYPFQYLRDHLNSFSFIT